jgi:hypothetical protein
MLIVATLVAWTIAVEPTDLLAESNPYLAYGTPYAKSLGATADELERISTGWGNKTADELFEMYEYIFPNGNRNAASHLWATFILDRADQMSSDKLDYFFRSFCPISGSPVQPDSVEQTYFYDKVLEDVNGVPVSGVMVHCCAPCICDSTDWLTVDTKTVTTSDGPQEYSFVVLGKFCEAAGTDTSLIPEEAPDVTCTGNDIDGATLSDQGYPIVGMLHTDGITGTNSVEMHDFCEEREQAGYQSGMGQIFIDVAKINPIPGSHSATVVVAEAPAEAVQVLEGSDHGFIAPENSPDATSELRQTAGMASASANQGGVAKSGITSAVVILAAALAAVGAVATVLALRPLGHPGDSAAEVKALVPSPGCSTASL